MDRRRRVEYMSDKAQALGYSREGDIVTIRLAQIDFDALLMCLGAAAAGDNMRPLAVRTVNAVNAGRPLSEWIPFLVP